MKFARDGRRLTVIGRDCGGGGHWHGAGTNAIGSADYKHLAGAGPQGQTRISSPTRHHVISHAWGDANAQ